MAAFIGLFPPYRPMPPARYRAAGRAAAVFAPPLRHVFRAPRMECDGHSGKLHTERAHRDANVAARPVAGIVPAIANRDPHSGASSGMRPGPDAHCAWTPPNPPPARPRWPSITGENQPVRARLRAGTRARGEVRESVSGHGHGQPPSAMTMPAFARGHSHQPSSSRRKVGEAWRQRTSPRTARARTASSAQRAQPALEACTAQDPTRRSMQSARVDAAHACERGAHFPPFGAFRGLAWILNDVSRALSLQRPIHFLVHPPPKSQSDWSKPP